MDEKQFQELVEKVGKEAAEKIKSQVAEATKGMITVEQLDEKLKALVPDAKTIKMGEGDAAKTLDEAFRDMGKTVTDALKKLEDGGGQKADFKSMLSEKMDEVGKMMKKGEGSISLSLKAAAIMTTDNTIDENEPEEDLIESFSIGNFVEKRKPRQYVFDMADRTTVANVEKYKTWLEEGDKQGAFALVAEGGLKPLVSMALVRNYSEAFKAAGKYVVTEEFTKWRKVAYNIIKRLIRDEMMRDYASILTTKLLADSVPYTASALDGQFVNVTDYHAIGAVAAQIEAINFMPDVLILNPQDKWRIGLSQDTVGQFYLTIPMTDPSGETRMMGFIVRTSNELDPGEAILGESGLWKIEDEAVTVRMGYGISVTKDGANVTEVESDIDHNRMRVIVETYAHGYIASNHIGSFVKFDFDTVKEALQAEPAV